MSEFRIPFPFAPVPITAIDDAAIGDAALRVYTLMLAIREGDTCKISERRLAQRLRRSPRTVHTLIHKLIDAGYIQQINAKTKSCGHYRLVCLTAANSFSTLAIGEGHLLQNSSPSAVNGFSRSAEADCIHPIVKNLPREGRGEQNEDEERYQQDRLRLVELLTRAALVAGDEKRQIEVDFDREADRLLRRHSRAYERDRLFGHLSRAITDPSLANFAAKVTWADRKTQRGEPVGVVA